MGVILHDMASFPSGKPLTILMPSLSLSLARAGESTPQFWLGVLGVSSFCEQAVTLNANHGECTLRYRTVELEGVVTAAGECDSSPTQAWLPLLQWLLVVSLCGLLHGHFFTQPGAEQPAAAPGAHPCMRILRSRQAVCVRARSRRDPCACDSGWREASATSCHCWPVEPAFSG